MKLSKMLLFLTLLSSSKVYCQIKEMNRLELDKELVATEIINLYSNGIATVDVNVFTFYDNDLNNKTKIDFKGMTGYYYDTVLNKMLVFHSDLEGRYLTFISPKGKKENTITLTVEGKRPVSVSDRIVILQNQSFFTIKSKGKDCLSTLNLQTGEIKKLELPNQWQKRSIYSFQRLGSDKLLVLYKDQNETTKIFKNLAVIDDVGNVIEDNIIDEKDNIFSINEFSVSNLGNDEFMLSGTFSNNRYTINSIGVFIAKIVKTQLANIEFKEFEKIENFYTHYPKNGGYSALTYTYPSIKFNDKIIITMDFKNPYTTVISDFNLSFKGFDYFNVLILEVSLEGEINATHSVPFEFREYPSTDFPKLKFEVDDVTIKYSYLTTNGIKTFTLYGDELDIKKTKPYNSIDVEKLYAYSKTFDIWYEKYYFSYQWDVIKKSPFMTTSHYYLVKYKVD